MIVRKLDELKTETVDLPGVKGVLVQGFLGPEQDLPDFWIRVFTLEPGGCTALHHHPQEHLHFVLSGEGVLVDASGERRAVGPGDFAFIAPDEFHPFVNASSEEPVRFLDVVGKFGSEISA